MTATEETRAGPEPANESPATGAEPVESPPVAAPEPATESPAVDAEPDDPRKARAWVATYFDGLPDDEICTIRDQLKSDEHREETEAYRAKLAAGKAEPTLPAELVRRFGEHDAREIVKAREDTPGDRVDICLFHYMNVSDEGNNLTVFQRSVLGAHGLTEHIQDRLTELCDGYERSQRAAMAVGDEITVGHDLKVWGVAIMDCESGSGDTVAQFAGGPNVLANVTAKIRAMVGHAEPDAKPLTNPSSMVKIQMMIANEYESFDGGSLVEVATIIGDDSLPDECRAALAGVGERLNARYAAYLRRQATGNRDTEPAAEIPVEPADAPETNGSESKPVKPKHWSGLAPMLSIAFTLLLACGITWATVDAVVSPQIRTISERLAAVTDKLVGLERAAAGFDKLKVLLESGRMRPDATQVTVDRFDKLIDIANEQAKGIAK